MGRELLDDKRANERSKRFKPQDDKDIRQNNRAKKTKKKLVRKEVVKKEVKNLVGVLFSTVGHYFPEFNDWLRQIEDVRNQRLIIYKRETIVWTQLLAMLSRIGSRKRISDQMRQGLSFENLKVLSGQGNLEAVPQADTLDYFNWRSELRDLEIVQVKMVNKFIRSRAIEYSRLKGKYYTVAIDGCHVHSFNYRHCDNCLEKTDSNKKTIWQHYKLQATLVTPEGLSLPLASEWIENTENKGSKYEKQDCELKAFYRLIKKLREYYTRLPMCLLLDGLYANRPVFKVLKEVNLKWIIVFKEGSMPEHYKWVMGWKDKFAKGNKLETKAERIIAVRKKRSHEERLIRKRPEYLKRRIMKKVIYSWMAGIKHWREEEKEENYNIITCKETLDKKERCDYVWLVSDGLELNSSTVREIAQRGRSRWKIENEGFNTEKNGGYNLEHCYSKDPVAMKVWSKMIEIAHFISQLIERGSLIDKKLYGSFRNIARELFEHLRYFVFVKSQERPRIQIRFKPVWVKANSS